MYRFFCSDHFLYYIKCVCWWLILRMNEVTNAGNTAGFLQQWSLHVILSTFKVVWDIPSIEIKNKIKDIFIFVSFSKFLPIGILQQLERYLRIYKLWVQSAETFIIFTFRKKKIQTCTCKNGLGRIQKHRKSSRIGLIMP